MSVKVFIAMAPPEIDGPDPQWDAERMVFIKDGFSVPAFLIPVIWLFWQRMWLPFLAYLLYLVALGAVETSAGQGVSWIIATGVAILFGLEANNLRRWSLAAKGWRTIGEAIGRNRDEAEMHFFRDWARPSAAPRQAAVAVGQTETAVAERDPPKRKPPEPRSASRPASGDEPRIFGLFPEADR